MDTAKLIESVANTLAAYENSPKTLTTRLQSANISLQGSGNGPQDQTKRNGARKNDK